ncbi:Arm DNA-binding domain-containing protein [Brenneria roseae]|uniref:Arm DNA-binding domain-containing protein n=1 Tax=Brenneria roseae TaxID=1509241 RepID=UPI003CD0CB44
MLAETKLKALKPKDKLYKVADRDGLYVTVAKSGLLTFRFDYQINSRRETLTIGKVSNYFVGVGARRDTYTLPNSSHTVIRPCNLVQPQKLQV